MKHEELKERVSNILRNHNVGTLATVKNNKPHTRYMTFQHDENLTLFTPTNKETYKAEEIDGNPFVHILIGYEGEGSGDAYLEIQGQAQIREDQDIKTRIWNEHMKHWFDGKEDPEYIVLEIFPETIRLMNDSEDTPEQLDM
ncbi:pyridoxamine 5'-phosphate oxidase family protein [Salimicrobium flavidum]|uniref:General stress protein 26 n=1 Tax=Salimicrobium flavidum TaxID=570947 RepID=A0A1N7K744_9BACI|nr:pyridoxamine 5'-phosphate oxidase family protein [Salimicrobium flavidum]SIS57264.1 General stress protein 26 [Salimicrobium flavidum]